MEGLAQAALCSAASIRKVYAQLVGGSGGSSREGNEGGGRLSVAEVLPMDFQTPTAAAAAGSKSSAVSAIIASLPTKLL